MPPVWLAHVLAQAGNSQLLVDADPSGSALEWSDLAAMYPRLAPAQAAFPFRLGVQGSENHDLGSGRQVVVVVAGAANI